ncbi:MAG TPA: 50S ribosomal protein L9 [Aestuariivirgaceae bacterium]|jgi:large subunit ribosomal protein L9
MEVILLERVEKLGSMGQVVKVKDGFARNYLLPQGKAMRATEANKQKFERERSKLEARNAERRSGAENEAVKLNGKSFVILRQAGESGQLYGSVTTRDIADVASSANLEVLRTHVMLEQPIKTIGLYKVKIALHPEVISEVQVNVARTQDEAEAQARGEILTGTVSEREEARIAAEELFEAEALAKAQLETKEPNEQADEKPSKSKG